MLKHINSEVRILLKFLKSMVYHDYCFFFTKFQVHLMDEFDILQIVGEGWFGKILLVEHRATDTEMVLKGSLQYFK